MTYRIQKVSQKLEVPRSTIRYWETEFPQLIRPKRTNGGQRRYSEQDISKLHKIKNLLHHKNKTIDEARIILKQGNTDTGKIDWENQSILLTGGTGSFGKHFCRIMIEKYRPRVWKVLTSLFTLQL
jgi:UDP-N-acetylglucosamine 4,6-dehydratase